MNPAQNKMRFSGWLTRQVAALIYVFKVLVPIILRTGKRPVIFSRWSGMGDIICTIPAAQELKKRHPKNFLIYNCKSDFAAVPKLAGIADCVTSLEAIGLVGYWYQFFLAGYYAFAHGDDLPGVGSKEPMVTEFCRQFNLLPHVEHPKLLVASAAREKVASVFREKNLNAEQLILFHPGPSWPVKEWPHEKWTELASQLRALGHTQLAQLGVASYSIFGAVNVPEIPGVVSLVDAFTIEECIMAIGAARLFVGIDSGLLHIAACMRTPAVGIFGPTFAQNFYAPDVRKNFVQSRLGCAGCFHRQPRLNWLTGCPFDILCQKKMEVPEVLAACLTQLHASDKRIAVAI